MIVISFGILVGILLFLLPIVLRQPTVKGMLGEWKVRRILAQLDRDQYIVLP